nr:integrase, catalytic region, zinc finger, CCHC-type, peptidase aspartic, catalytic [Tanacetum cinerariifolium]
MVDEDDETSKDKEIDKLMALISLSNVGYENQRNGTVARARETIGSTVVQKYGIQCYNCKEFGHVTREYQKPKRTKDAAYHREKMLLCKQEEAGIQLNAEQSDWRDDTDDDELEDQELEAHYMYMAQLQQVSTDADDSGPIFDDEPLQKVSNDDHYNVFAMEKINQNDDDNDLAKERELLASLIEKLKCEIDESKIHNKFLETSNKALIKILKGEIELIEKLKGEIEDFKTKNKSLESSNNFFKEANNRLSETNNLLYADYKKSEAELARRNIQTMNMLNNKCQMSFAKPEFLKKAQRANPRLYDIGVIPTTSVSRPQLKSNSQGYRVMHNNSQGKKQEVEDHRRSVNLSKNKTSVTACNDSLNAKTLNVKYVCATCDKCVPLCQILHCLLILLQLVEIVLFIVDSGCSKHMTGNLKLLINFVEKFLGTVKFGNDQIAPILGYGDLVQGAVTIKRVYYVEGLNHNLFSVGQFYNADLEVAFRKSTCFIRDLKGNDLLTGSRGTDLYSITLQDTNCPNPICLMAKATSSQAWLWHRRLSHLNFDTINLLSKNDIVAGLPKLKFLKDHLCSSWILHQTSVARTPEQKGVVERRNRTLVEAARTMISDAKVPLFFWVEAIATACFTQNHSLVIPRHEKTPYHIINDQKPSVKFFHIFGSTCYVVRDGENLDKMKEKDHISSDPVPECQTMALNHDSLSPAIQRQENVTQADRTVTTSNELDLLFKPTVSSSENFNQAETYAENDQVADDEFINIFSTPVQDQGETSSCHVDSSNMHTFYQRYPSEHRWIKDHPLEQVIGNPSQSIRTRRQLESDAKMCMFALTVIRTEPKNIKEAMADSAWIESMQEELHQFDRLDV